MKYSTLKTLEKNSLSKKPTKGNKSARKVLGDSPAPSTLAKDLTDSQPDPHHLETSEDDYKRKYDTISDEDRLKLILLIKDFGMSCHKASKVLNIAYNNAKVIYRIYKNERRIR